MADAAAAADEDHGDIGDVDHGHAVVRRSAANTAKPSAAMASATCDFAQDAQGTVLL